MLHTRLAARYEAMPPVTPHATAIRIGDQRCRGDSKYSNEKFDETRSLIVGGSSWWMFNNSRNSASDPAITGKFQVCLGAGSESSAKPIRTKSR
jgi:hypothetical protein